MILKNDYISCKDYNLMKSFSKCLYIYEFCAISICFIGHKVYNNEWTIWCVKVLMFFILCKTKPLILKNYGWPYIDDYEGMVSLKFWIYVLF
jgi:hypothetical protein